MVTFNTLPKPKIKNFYKELHGSILMLIVAKKVIWCYWIERNFCIFLKEYSTVASVADHKSFSLCNDWSSLCSHKELVAFTNFWHNVKRCWRSI